MQNALPTPSIEELLVSTPYRPIELLGRGGMGKVFVVENAFLGRRFALKIINPHLAGDPGLAERVRLEAQTMGRLSHPNIVEVVDLWIAHRDFPCIVMELLQGRTLADELRARRRLPALEAVDLAVQILSGLAAAHAIGVVHRDIKPQNLYLHSPPGYPRALKILDFGLARVMPWAPPTAPPALAIPTKSGTLVGSALYMSPEAARGERVDHRADLYCVGLVLFEMLTGSGPFDDGSMSPKPPSSYLHGQISPELDAIVLGAIMDDPAARYQTAHEFIDALQAFRASCSGAGSA